jgi:glucose/arabinose dehydrogenase
MSATELLPRRARGGLCSLAALAALALAALAVPARAAHQLPAGFTESLVASGLASPTAMAIASDGRIFVCEQGGALRVIESGRLLPRPFVRLNVNAAGERGLLGVALDPDFPRTPYVYLYYTAVKPRVHNRVSRFTAKGNRARAGSELRLLDLPALGATNHNGGALHFGADGMLYVGVGENGVGDDAQSLATPLGKILRVRPDGRIPADNPLLDETQGIARAIWAYGLRNPFTFAVAGDGRIFINDVGASRFEEVDVGVAGANYGWPVTEGPTSDPRFEGPLFSYPHGAGGAAGCAITGAAFYDPQHRQFPVSFDGSYFFGDLCNGWVRRLDAFSGFTAADFGSGFAGPVDLDVAADGSLYVLEIGGGALWRISHP